MSAIVKLFPDEVAAAGEVALHRVERHVPVRRLLPDALGVPLGLARVGDQEPDDGDRRLVLILLEELPLEHLGALVSVVGDEPGAVAEIPENRVRLRERPTVVEHERRHPPRRIEIAEHLGAIRAVDDAELVELEREAEVGCQKAHLVAVAGDRGVVEEHRPTLAHGSRRRSQDQTSGAVRETESDGVFASVW